MNNIIDNIIKVFNDAGRTFCDFSLNMFVQVSVLIVVLLIIDILIRKRVRATFRYCIWMLVFIKLILPPALSLPTGIGNWFGEYFVVSSENIDRRAENINQESSISAESFGTEFSPRQVRDFQNFSRTDTPQVTETPEVSTAPQAIEPDITNANSITWQGGIFLIWLIGVLVLSVLLIQRIFFVKGLIAQSEPAKNRLLDTLQECSAQLGIKRNIQMKLSHNASSPAVCGLFKPVILIPANLLSKISHDKFKAILIHELSHIKRNDLLVNCAQTILQILYFYNPLVWLANSIVRKIREQAVDEMVLVALGAEAKSYTNTLIDVAEMAFSRPALSLRLVGVVESKKALSERIKHILSRPFPKSAKLGILGLFVILITAVILLPMAKNDTFSKFFGTNVLVRFYSEEPLRGKSISRDNTETYSKDYTVKIKKGEKLAIVAELYQVGKPMQAIGYKVFTGQDQPQHLSVILKKRFMNEEKTSVLHDFKVTLGDQILEAKGINVETSDFFNNTVFGVFQGSQIAVQKDDGKPYIDYEKLLYLSVHPNGGQPPVPEIWMPGYNVTWINGYYLFVKMLPLSQIDNLRIDAPYIREQTQLPDGSYLSVDSTLEECRAVVDDYLQNLKEELLKSQMPLPKLTAHQFYKIGEPVIIKTQSSSSGQWKPTLEDLDISRNLCYYLIDGQEYDSILGFGPFDAAWLNLNIPGDIYKRDLKLPVGKHKVSFGWKDIYAINLDEPQKALFYERLLTNPVEFEVVEEVPDNYYGEVYEEGWDEILANNIEVRFTDDTQKLQVAGVFLVLVVKPMPFEIAFDVYAQAEGSEEREYLTRFARKANPPGGNYVMACEQYIKDLTWDNVGQKRYRLILVPSEKAAIANPPVTHYYGMEYITEWATFEKSKEFDRHYEKYNVSNKTNWTVDDIPQTKLLSEREVLETKNWVSVIASVVKTNGRYLVPESGLTLKDLIRKAGYNNEKLDESYVEVVRTTKQAGENTRLIFSRNLKMLFSGEESDITLKTGDSVLGGYIGKTLNFDEFWSPYHFTDVIELIINDDNGKTNMFADLDTGKLITPPDTLDNTNKANVLEWIANNGIDLLGETAQDVQGLVGYNMYAVQVDNFFWDADKSKIVDRFASVNETVLLSTSGNFPVTYLIKTSEYKLGVLQILGFTDNPIGIKVRYKLLKKNEDTANNGAKKQNEYSATLPSGVTVEFIGVCDIPADGKQWWTADGSLIGNVFWDGTTIRENYDRVRQVVFRILSDNNDPDIEPAVSFYPKRQNLPEGPSFVGVFTVSERGNKRTIENLRGLSFSLNDEQDRIDIDATVGYGQWEIQTRKKANEAAVLYASSTKIGELIFNDPTETEGKTTIAATLLNQVEAWRIIAIDNQGATHRASTSLSGGNKVENGKEYQLFRAEFNLSLSEIAEFQFQTRNVEKFTFKNVSLEQGLKTDVQILAKNISAVEATAEGGLGENKQDAKEVHKIYLPDLETSDKNVVLDFATGQMLSAWPMQDDELYFNKLGLGDLVYEHADNKGGLMCLRGAKLELLTQSGVSQLTPDAEDEFFVGYYVNEVPVSYRITTAKGEKYDITVLSKVDGDDGGLNIEYRKTDVQIEKENTLATEVAENSENDLNINVEQPKLFTLSDNALMSLDDYSGSTARIIDKRDTAGPGVEFDIYFPPGGDSLSYNSSRTRGKAALTYIDLDKYIGYSLKFTLLNVKSDTPNIDKARLGVGANIGSPGRYKPAFFYLTEKNKTVVSSTGLDSLEIKSFDYLGFTAYLLSKDFINTNGVTLTLKIEAVSGADIVEPMQKTDKVLSEADKANLLSMFITIGTTCESVESAINKGDIETAKKLCESIEEVTQKMKALAKSTEFEAVVTTGAMQFDLMHQALKEGNIENAKTYINVIMQLGNNSSQIFKQLISTSDNINTSVNKQGGTAAEGIKENRSEVGITSEQERSSLQQMIDSAKPESTIIIPNGKYTQPVEITKPLILKGQSRKDCILEITADNPAVFINTKSKGKVTLENMTIKWQLATSDQSKNPYAVAAKDSVVFIKNCSFEPLGNSKRSPEAVRSIGFSDITIDTCRFEGFEYTVCFGEGSKGTIRNCLVMDSGHQGISLYEGAVVKIIGNVVTGSKYHGVRSTGGTLDMKDNLIIKNDNRGVYLGNKSANGMIENNVIIGNGSGISGFSQSKVTIENNVIADDGYAGVDMRDSCKFSIRDNIIKGNERGLALFKESGKNNNEIFRNTFWQNKTETQDIDKHKDSIIADPLFNDAENGDFSLKTGTVQEAKQGLKNAEIFISLWKRWENRADKNEPFADLISEQSH